MDILILLRKYPENIQLYYFIAKGYWQMGRYRQANQYATQGLQQLSQLHTQFIDQHRIALKAHLLRYQYRYLGINEKWSTLLMQTQQNPDPSGVSQAYHAYALRKLNRPHEAVDLAQKVLATLKKENLSMPFFVSPYPLSMEDSLKRFVQKYVLKE